MLTHPGVHRHRLDLKQNCICAIQQNLLVENVLVGSKRVRARNCAASSVRRSPTHQYIRKLLHPPYQLCVPSKPFVVDSESRTVS
ncbi:uncharacterized protein BJ212DRAFT_1327683 [Suillus subaureus]|uniref:Uncharacterized protein n=1 Tax=Suillus subaureus TaxID=48587 RepID=A0A9P7EJ56_9AGAM|nr:uncharacterized protein BJ212DRAFT_1327683 [Suillus subaureus]KAG1822414.1 hypothetical protein BJ212DRAFT_1327683 [Suillus subaureus]